jgi:pyridoxine kinase
VKIVDMETLKQAITTLHQEYKVPHIVVTSISFPGVRATPSLSVVGSTFTSTSAPRIFEIKIPAIDCFFSGTGDMFAALMVVRLREAVHNTEGLAEKSSWVSRDEVEATELPLAKACEKVLASMQEVLARTKEARDVEVERYHQRVKGREEEEDEKKLKLVKSKAAEVRLVRNVDCLRHPEVKYKAEKYSDVW